ncbi:bifunctional protein GlmU-like [Hyalella azteca]|uniref:Bifunctional protein GlmU-like n=1 Tax=Hyalella azteca TaxID=294128 RepID=A0A8B7N3I3_HYAAZ|nr:bifunctional protein GlmU-like [Hyalella azteca]
MRVHVIRLRPGTEVTEELQRLAREELQAGGCVLTCVGSVTGITLRFASQDTGGDNKIQSFKGHYEVLSLVGTLTKDGLHLHTCLGDKDGKTIGGHVMGDMVTYTTMELVIGVMEDFVLTREFDEETKFDELVVTPAK